jgi:Putative zinc-finger
MLNCKQSAVLMSQELDRSLSLRERINLRLHTLICNGCRNARQQMEFIRHACQSWIRRDD